MPLTIKFCGQWNIHVRAGSNSHVPSPGVMAVRDAPFNKAEISSQHFPEMALKSFCRILRIELTCPETAIPDQFFA